MEKYAPYSELKMFHHFDRMEGLVNGQRVAPVYVRIKPTNVCNQNCFYCGYANDILYDGRRVDRRESISWECMERTVLELAGMGVKAVTFSGGGEPLCYHSIGDTLRLVQRLGMDYSMITNGQALEGEAVEMLKDAKWVRVSFDACKPGTYEGIRRVDTYEKVVYNIGNFAKAKSRECTLGINCVVTKQNYREIFEICKLAKGMGADNIKLSPLMVKDGEAGYHEMIKDTVTEQINRAKSQLEGCSFRVVDKYTDDLSMEEGYEKKYHRCIIQELFTVIAADSKVYRCHQTAYTEAGEIGDLKKQTFREIWHSSAVVDDVGQFDAYKACRFRCAFDERNMLLNDFLHMDRSHINFI